MPGHSIAGEARADAARDGFSAAAPSYTGGRPVSPALVRYAPALVLFAIVVADCARFAGTDLWGHIAFGETMLKQGRVPWLDYYSYSAPGMPYFDHEWLAQVIMAGVYDALGVVGLKLMKLAITAATILLLAGAERETGASPGVQSGVLMAVALTLLPQMQFRPQLFTFMLMAALLLILARDNYRGHAPVWLLVPMMMLWVNLHGGFIVGLAVIAAYGGVAGLQDLLEGRGWRRPLCFAAVTGATAAATLATPYGTNAWGAIFQTFERPSILSANTEWQPLTFFLRNSWDQLHGASVFLLIVFAILIFLAVTLVLTPSREDLPLVAVAIVMGISPFVSVRNMALAMIAAAVPLARHCQMLVDKVRRGSARGTARSTSDVLLPAAQIFMLSLAMLLAVETGLFSRRMLTSRPSPLGALAFMQRHDLHGNVLCNFEWGEFMIFHDADSRVFIDGRYQLVYPPKVIEDYLAFYHGLSGGAGMLESYQHDYALISPGAEAYKLMSSRKDWKLIYSDSASVLFARAQSRAADIPGIPVAGVAPVSYFP
jgi:hypothetical protein